MFDIDSEYLELWVSPSSEYLKFEFRRVLKMNSEFPVGPEKRTTGTNIWTSTSAEFRKWTLSSLMFQKNHEKTTSSSANAYSLEEVSNFKRKRSPWFEKWWKIVHYVWSKCCRNDCQNMFIAYLLFGCVFFAYLLIPRFRDTNIIHHGPGLQVRSPAPPGSSRAPKCTSPRCLRL